MMHRLIRPLTWLALPLALIASQPALAWGEYAHRLTGRIALAQLTPAVRAEVKRLYRAEAALNTPECRLRSIEEASVWPDCVRARYRDRFAFSAPWHYQNISVCGDFDITAKCPDGDCVTVQISRQQALAQFAQDDSGGIAPLIIDDPLAQLDRTVGKFELDIAVFGMIGILGGDGGRGAIIAVTNHHFRLSQINGFGKDQRERRFVQRIGFRCGASLFVEDRDSTATCDDQGLLGRVIFKPHTAGAFDQDLSRGDGAVAIDLGEFALGGLQRVEIGGKRIEGELLGGGGQAVHGGRCGG